MVEVFILIGWLSRFPSGGVIIQEFKSQERCELARDIIIKKHEITNQLDEASWVECFRK